MSDHELLGERGITDVRIFGSLARGDADEGSDIDLMVELPGDHSPGGELLEVLELSELLSSIVGTRVDVVTARSLRTEVRESVLKEAKVIESVVAEQLDQLEESVTRLLDADG